VADTVTRPVRSRAARTDHSVAAWVRRALVIVFVGLLVLVPVVLLIVKAFEPGFHRFWSAISNHNSTHAFELSAIVTGCATVLDVIFGIAVAVLLTRYRFPGRRLLNGLIDLPLAVSPIVVGFALLLVYGPQGWWGNWLDHHVFQVIFADPGIVMATVFVSFPLVARAIVPVLDQAGIEQEQAAESLGASAFTRFRRITLPTIRVALAYGTVLAFARCLGEYGAVLVVTTHIEGQTETAPTRIGNLISTDQDYKSAYEIAFVLMFVAVVAIALGALIRRRQEKL
jgi:sulfate/thiosulfate transport system permease protein